MMIVGPMRDPDLQVESPTFRGAINSSTPNVGPFHEGQSLDLYCTADPGRSVLVGILTQT